MGAAIHAGLSLDEFWNATPRETWAVIAAKQDSDHRIMTEQLKIVRWQSALIMGMFAKKGQSISPTDLLTLPDEATGDEDKQERLAQAKIVWAEMDKAQKLKHAQNDRLDTDQSGDQYQIP